MIYGNCRDSTVLGVGFLGVIFIFPPSDAVLSLPALVALGVGYFPVTFLDVSPALSLAMGTGTLVLILLLKGKRVDAPADAGSVP